MALSSNTTGSGLVALGNRCLQENTTGGNNVAAGSNALRENTTASANTAFGGEALRANTTGTQNTAVGYNALNDNTTAGNNTAFGYNALATVTTGSMNTCVGSGAGTSTTTGYGNTFIGLAAGGLNTTGINNTFIGGRNGSGHTSGYEMTGSDNVIIGCYNGNSYSLDLRTADAHIVLSNGYGTPQVNIQPSGNVIIRRSDYSSINAIGCYNDTTSAGANLHVNSSGSFVRSTSSIRYKNTVNDATHGLTELMTLRPVTYKGNNDGDTVFGGLIAEEVHDAGLTEFVQYNVDNQPDALAYGNMVSLCIKAIQELSATNDALTARITALEDV
jgi:hypothetical protein